MAIEYRNNDDGWRDVSRPFRTIDGNRPAPCPGMDDDDLVDYERFLAKEAREDCRERYPAIVRFWEDTSDEDSHEASFAWLVRGFFATALVVIAAIVWHLD